MAADNTLAMPPGDQAEAQSLARKRAVLQALLQGAIGPQQGQMVSGHYVGNGLAGNLARIATGFVAGDKLKGLDEQDAALAGKYNSGLAAAAQRYMDLQGGTPDQPMGPPTEGGDYGVQAGKPANPRAAIVEAMTSGYKPLQQLGMEELKLMGKGRDETFSTSPVRTKDNRAVTVGNRGSVKVLPLELPDEFMQVGDRVVSKSDPTKVAADYRGLYGDPTTLNGDLYQAELGTKKLYKLDNATKVNVHASANAPAAESEYLKTRGKGVGEAVNELQKRAGASTATLRSVQQLKALDAQGTFNNITAGAATFSAQLASSLGIPVDQAKMANSETYRAEVRNLLIAQMQQLGGAKGLSEKETQLVLEAFPNLERSPQARQVILDIMERKARQNILEYQTALEHERRAYPSTGMFNFDFSTPGSTPGGMATLPPAAPAGAGGPRVKNW